MGLLSKMPKGLGFILLVGIVSMFADMAYEGARSINGPFLGILGASAFVVAMVAGLGELLGYVIRLLSGYVADKTRAYWFIIYSGYAINLLSIPVLAYVGYWPVAAFLIILERAGWGFRSPARDALLSVASKEMGHGKIYGIHESLDQIGATAGPLLMALALYLKADYHYSYLLLWVPVLLTIITLFLSRAYSPPLPQKPTDWDDTQSATYPESYWYLTVAMGLVALGYADFALIAFHWQKHGVLAAPTIPVFYAITMVTQAFAALILGHAFDKWGRKILIGVCTATALYAPLVFLGNAWGALLGMLIWGTGMAAQESVVKAMIAKMIPAHDRAKAFGLFNTVFGLGWFLGSLAIGYLYSVSMPGLLILVVISQWLAVLLLCQGNNQKSGD